MGFHTSIHCHVIVITTCGTPRHCLYLGLALLRRTRPLEYLECLSPTLLGQYWLMKQNMKGNMAYGIQEVGMGHKKKLLIVLRMFMGTDRFV